MDAPRYAALFHTRPGLQIARQHDGSVDALTDKLGAEIAAFLDTQPVGGIGLTVGTITQRPRTIEIEGDVEGIDGGNRRRSAGDAEAARRAEDD